MQPSKWKDSKNLIRYSNSVIQGFSEIVSHLYGRCGGVVRLIGPLLWRSYVSISPFLIQLNWIGLNLDFRAFLANLLILWSTQVRKVMGLKTALLCFSTLTK